MKSTALTFSDFRDQFGSFLFVLPAVAIFVTFYVYPFFEIFRLSLQDWDGISLTREWVGIANFIDLVKDSDWWRSMFNAGYITLVALTFQNALAFALALACDRGIKFEGVYRVIFFIPPVLSEIVVGLIWSWILYAGTQNGQHIGLLNSFFDKAGFPHLVNDWLSDPKTVLVCVAVVHCWKGFGWGFIMFLAGLQSIDRQMYEAARVDGAGGLRIFWNVTVPNMIPVIVVVTILTVLGSMQVFVLILALVGQSGGLLKYTGVPVTMILRAMMTLQKYGYACAMGINLGMILVAVSFVLKNISDRVKQA